MKTIMKTLYTKAEPDPWRGGFPAKREARLLFTMIGRNGDTVEKIRELIAVPPRIESVLRAYAAHSPAEGPSIEGVLRYRRKVAKEFEALLRVSAGA